MTSLSEYDPEKLDLVAGALRSMGLEMTDAVTDSRVISFADNLHAAASKPGDVQAVNKALDSHDKLGFLLPGYFRVSKDDLRLSEPDKGEK